MKRSEINGAIADMERLLDAYRFSLPDFCRWTPAEWAAKGPEYDEIRDNMLGWDITDFGGNRFGQMGLTLITLRNGSARDARYPKPYAEKIMMLTEGQSAPMHFHWYNMEDIINRGGGDVVFRLYRAAGDESLADTDVTVSLDGRVYAVRAGAEVTLTPGQSLTLSPGTYHDFRVGPGKGPALIGEVSMRNDDRDDNRFLEPLGRFASVEEDEPPYRLLCNEYGG
jgi:D-lyxose ketol-isomerase